MIWYITLLVCGLFLIGLEIFVPGGILGAIGAAALLATILVGFHIFPLWAGWLNLFAVGALTGVSIFLWIRYLPRSPIGKALSLSETVGRRDPNESNWDVGLGGTALCDLRPAGKALLNGKRVDVIADHGMFIAAGTEIQIVRACGNRIYVKGNDTNA